MTLSRYHLGLWMPSLIGENQVVHDGIMFIHIIFMQIQLILSWCLPIYIDHILRGCPLRHPCSDEDLQDATNNALDWVQL